MATINGTANDDTLNGTAAADTINGLGGKDNINGNDGDDLIHGDGGDDSLAGGVGDDILEGGAGNDFLVGRTMSLSWERDGHDQLFGGDGDDSINTYLSESYVVDGGAGSDQWSNDFWWMQAPITLDAGLVASAGGWSFGDITVRNVERTDLALGSGDDTFINNTAGTTAYIGTGSGADQVFVSNGRNEIDDGFHYEDAGTDRLVIDYSGAVAGLRSRIEDFRAVGATSSGHKIWEGADYETATRAISTIGFDVVEIMGSRFGDQIIGSEGRDLILGGNGNDVLTALLGNDLLDGGAGSDTLNLDLGRFAAGRPGGLPSRYLLNGATIDLESGEAQALPVQQLDLPNEQERFYGRVTLQSVENIVGTGLGDTLYGSSGANRLTGGGGHDLLAGRGGNDRLSGDGGDDTILGGAGADVLSGGAGIDTVSYGSATATVRVDLGVSGAQDTRAEGLDTLSGFENAVGGAAGDRLVGSAVANRLDGGAGADTLVGRDGDDIYIVDDAADRAIEDSVAGGVDTVRSTLDFTLGLRVENLVLTGNEALAGTGNGGANALTGNRAANVLRGEAGNDVLAGGAGDDSLFGGAGRDTLNGGAGSDDFRFDAELGGINVDRIAGFLAADDTIMLDRDIFSEIENGTLSESAFHAGTTAADGDDRILYDDATGRIFYDSDGTGGTAAILFARVEAGTTLTHADFVGYI
jgi:Ca2+-binding RTX toxin-like protein